MARTRKQFAHLLGGRYNVNGAYLLKVRRGQIPGSRVREYTGGRPYRSSFGTAWKNVIPGRRICRWHKRQARKHLRRVNRWIVVQETAEYYEENALG